MCKRARRPACEEYAVVFDCESDSAFADLPGRTHEEKLKFMQFTVICALVVPVELIRNGASADEIVDASFEHSWWRDVAEEGGNPISTLLDLFDGAKLIVGYNCLGFDFPLVRRHYRSSLGHARDHQRYVDHRSKTLDLMARARDATGEYFKLDYLLKRNGLQTKSSNGLQAIKMWDEGRRDELQDYCATDVALTAKLALQDTIHVSDYLEIDSRVFGLREYTK